MNLSIPISSAYQRVQFDGQLRQDAEGNSYARIYAENPPNPFTYSRQINVQISSRSTPVLPSSYMVPQQYSRFTAPTPRTQSDDPRIRGLALQITANSTDPFEKLAKIAIWVNKHMAYNEGLVGEEKDALWVLENMQGVCVEYSTLFAALARSIGIPTRYISGYVYSGKYGRWLGHAWNEAYIGEWVPVDATWFEVGATDALHIEGSRSAEMPSAPSLVASVSNPSAALKWDTTGKSGAIAGNIATLSAFSEEPSGDFELRAVQSSLAPGGKTLAYLSINGKDFRVIPVTLAGCVGGESVSVGGGDQFMLLRPGKTTVAVWELTASRNIPSNYIFTCPLTLNSPYLQNRRLDIQVDPRLQPPADFQAALQREKIAVGQENSVLLSLPLSRQGESYYIITEEGVKSQRVSAPTASIPFFAAGLGQRPIYVAGQKGGYKKLEYSASLNQSSISIDEFSIPHSAIAGVQAKARVLVSSQAYPADIALQFTFDGKSASKSGRISAPTEFEFDFVPSSAGSIPATVSLSGDAGAEDKQSEIVEVEQQPKLELASTTAKKSGGNELRVVLRFKATGNVVSPKVSIAGEQKSAQGSAEFALPPGTYTAELSWQDRLGNQYSGEERIEAKAPGLLESLSGAAPAASAPPPCPLALGLIALIFASAIARS